MLTSAATVQAVPPTFRWHHFTGSSVLVVGDSHTWLPSPGAYSRWDVDAEPGRDSSAALRIVNRYLRPRHEIIVFDLATNEASSATFAHNLRRLWQTASGRSIVLVTTWTRGGDPVGVSEVLETFSSRHPNRTRLVDWARYMKAHPDAYVDAVHYTADAYIRRINKVKRAVRTLRRKLVNNAA